MLIKARPSRKSMNLAAACADLSNDRGDFRGLGD